MRISTNQIFLRGLNNMMQQQNQVSKIQQQISSEKKVSTASDDPISAAQINLMRHRLDTTTQLQKNREGANSLLSYSESLISNSVSVLQRARDLQVQSGNSALSEDDRRTMAIESRAMLDQLQMIANSQDTNGQYLYAGTKSSTQPITRTSTGEYIYNGDDTQRFQLIGNGLQVQINDTAGDLFMRIPSGNGQFSVSETSIPNTGSVVATSGTVTDMSSYIADEYTIQFALNTAGQMVYMVSGVASGSVLPVSGNADDAPLYVSDSAITFNGVQLLMRGEPQVGDGFQIKPSVNESVFSTLNRMITNFGQNFVNSTDKARVETENNQLLEQLDGALNNLLSHQASLGARLNQLESADQINTDMLETSQETLNQLENTNLTEAAVQLELQIIYLQAAQQSFMRIQNLSAFNYL